MPDYYETRKEAEEHLPREAIELGFCPLINSNCNTCCVCYRYSAVRTTGGTEPKWYIASPYCDNVLISGVIWIES